MLRIRASPGCAPTAWRASGTTRMRERDAATLSCGGLPPPLECSAFSPLCSFAEGQNGLDAVPHALEAASDGCGARGTA
jgi:hypothetical protein